MSMKLPMHEITKIRSLDNNLFFKFNKISFAIFDIVPSKEALKTLDKTKTPYPDVPYQYYLSVLESTPNDISFFNSRNKSVRILLLEYYHSKMESGFQKPDTAY